MSKIDPLITLSQVTCSWHYFKDNKNEYSNYTSSTELKFTIDSSTFQCYTKIGLIKSSKLLTTSSNLFENIFHLIKIVEIKFEGATLSNFDLGRETNWSVLTSIKKPNISNRIKNRTFPTTCSMKNNNEKDNLKSSIIKVETFMKRTFASRKIDKIQGDDSC